MTAASPSPQTAAPRMFGRFELRQMLGRSHASGTWLAYDPRLQQEVLLCVPRAQPADAKEKEAWTQAVQGAGRLKHPRLAEVLEIGMQDGWPFASCVRGSGVTLAERLASGPPLTPGESAALVCDVLEGLAYAHEAGATHQDIGLHNILLDQQQQHASLAALGCALAPRPAHGQAATASNMRARASAERDVLMVGLLLYRLLVNAPALDDADLGHAAERVGLEIVRLPWTTPHPVPDTLRAIVNRATDRQERQRYLNARTLLSALQGWIKTNSEESGGPLALLLDRLDSVGVLPSRPQTERALQAALAEDKLRVDDFVDVIARNPPLAWELLRATNVAGYTHQSADDGVTTLSRAVVLLGQQGLRRVAGGVRNWPGALAAQESLSTAGGEAAQAALRGALRQACVAGHIARLMAPFSVHDEEAAVAAMSQSLGWLLVLYHFPEEAGQISRLMAPPPPPPGADKSEKGDKPEKADAPPVAGMSLEAACGAVLGINLDDLTQAVLRHWGLHERLMTASRPLNLTSPVRQPRTPEETLRAVASMANEIAATIDLPEDKSATALHRVHIRYARAFGLVPKECAQTLDRAVRLVDRRGAPNVSPA